MNAWKWVVPVVCLTACGGFEPVAGEWVATNQTVVEDSCDLMEEETLEDGSLLLVLGEEEGAFHLVDDTDDMDIACTTALDDLSFTCTPHEVRESSEDLDIESVVSITISGTFVTESSISGTMDMVSDCEGEDCGLVEDQMQVEFPCTVEISFDAAVVE